MGATLAVLVSLLKRPFGVDAPRRTVIETITTTSSILVIAVGASLLTRFLALSGVSDAAMAGFAYWHLRPIWSSR